MDIVIDVSNLILETPRLILRAWRESDLEDLFEYASVPGIGEMAGWAHHETMDESLRVLRIFLAEKNVLAIVHKETEKVIGSFGFHLSWANNEPEYRDLIQKEIGYVLAKDYWGQGLMPEAVEAVSRYLFDECGVEAVTVGHFSANSQSGRVIEKCGFTFVRSGTFHAKQLGRDFDDRKYIRVKTETV